MSGLLCGGLAAMAIFIGLVCIAKKKHLPSALLGCADMAFVILSAQGLKRMLLESGKILTPELFGFGYKKPVFATYAIMFTVGLVCALLGAYGFLKQKRTDAPAAQA